MTTTIQLDSGIEERLTKLADQTGRSMDYYLASEVMERVRTGTEKTYSASSVRKELGLE